jgi:energy-coupling factor transporter ATP-binding protein EcfA2
VVTPQRFVLLLGPVGAGKTTFLEYTRQVSAKEVLSGRVIWLLVDFKKTTANEKPRHFIYHEVQEFIERDTEFNLGDWEHSIRPAYRDFIEARQRGTLAPLYKTDPERFEVLIAEAIEAERVQVEPFVDRVIARTAERLPVYLVIDNADQIEEESYQRELFAEAQAVARRMGAHVILSLRDSTFLRHRQSPAIDAFQYESLYIDPPPVRPVLKRRFEYAKRALAGKSASIATEGGLLIQVPDLSAFFELVATSLLRNPTGYMIEVLSESNVRRGLELVREFLASGHTQADHALRTYLTDGAFIFPEHEVFKGAVLGQYKYYREETSQLPNVFDSKLGSAKVQLLRFHVLDLLARCASEPAYDGTDVTRIVDDLSRLGIPESQILKVLVDLASSRCIQTADRLPLSSESRITPTRLGAYVAKELSGRLMYVEPCSMDACIYDEDSWKEMIELTEATETAANWRERLGFRLGRARAFAAYVKTRNEIWAAACARYGLASSWGSSDTNALAARLDADIAKAGRSADRMLKRNVSPATSRPPI